MSHEALILDLRRKSSDRIKKIWGEAEVGAEELRSLKREEFERRQVEVKRQLKDEAEMIAAPILHEARRSALAIEDEAMRGLSERLYALAGSMVVQLRQQDYEDVFATLVGEVPAIDWERVWVSPKDMELAGSFFPGAEIEEDPSIIGGFIAATDGGSYQVINTLERRLEKAWQVLLPLLLKEIITVKDAVSAE